MMTHRKVQKHGKDESNGVYGHARRGDRVREPPTGGLVPAGQR